MWHYIEDAYISLGFVGWGFLLGVMLSQTLFNTAFNPIFLAIFIGLGYLLRTKLD